ncbi:unnamed protein product [Clonostachys rosea]|uniref:Uncharacterized protein n=1 Tax=Bionectria ochroleuca TaxID=29856 RepID=A0ABY6U1H2_BIOOC|nr:unnamed protein product [Clonostachys rosea]
MASTLDLLRRHAAFRPLVGAGFSLWACYTLSQLLSRYAVRSYRGRGSWKWDKEVIVITGGSGGIGAALVERFISQGVTVVSLDIKPPPSTQVEVRDDKNRISVKKENNYHYYQVDLRSRSAVQEVVAQISATVGVPTVLINNAGLGSGRSLLDCDESSIRSIFDVNILSHFWLAQALLPAMIEADHGHIVSVASVASFVTIAGNIEYSCTKAGVMSFHEGLGQELKHRYGTKSVLTSIVYPYWVQTPLIQNMTTHPSFHDPLIGPEVVADKIVKHVMRGDRGGEIYLPWYGSLLAGIRGFPLWLQEFIRDSKAGMLRETTF